MRAASYAFYRTGTAGSLFDTQGSRKPL